MEENKSLDTNKKVKRWIILGFAVLILFNIYSLVKINDLQEQIQNDIYNLDRQMNTKINSVSYTLQDTLKKQESILSEFNYIEEGIDVENKAIKFTLQGSPKVYKNGLKFYFTYNSNEKTEVVEATLDENKNYSAKVSVPLDTEIKFGVTLDYGDEIKKEICENNYLDGVKHQLQLMPKGFDGSYKLRGNEVKFDGKITSSIYPSAMEGNYVVEPFYNVKINDTVVEELKLERNSQVPSEYSIDFNKTYKLNEGDRLDVFVEVYDTYGFHYKYCVMSMINENGKIVDMNFSNGNGVVTTTP